MAGQTTHYHLSKPTGAEAPDVSVLNGNMDTIDDELYTRAKSWNGIAADENGDIAATTIQLAENLSSSSNTTVEGEFVMRTSGGSSSVRDSVRSATLESVHGGRIHTGQAQGSAGTITQSTPMTFVSTGWNLYNHNSACAIVTRYSETYGFMVSGSYTALRYSATVNGARSEITPDSAGRFNVPGDGYVWVTGGNNTDTAIWATWSDWTVRYEGDFQPYTESVVDISEPINTYFPYGLMRVGNYWDEINLSTGQAYSVIERMDNTPTNMQTAEASGRAYEYDENYIYIVRQSTITYVIPNIDNAFTPNDHGMEYFTNTEAPATARCIYGVNLKNKLERDVLTISKQQLTAAQQAQVRENIGAGADSHEEVQTGTITLSSGATATFTKLGRVCSMQLSGQLTSSVAQWGTMGNIPELYLPVSDGYINNFGNIILFHPNSIIQAGYSMAENECVSGLATYITAQ